MYAKREALIKRRNQLGLTQRAMAEQLGLAYGSYGSIENGKNDTKLANWIKIGKVLGIKDGVKDMRLFVLLNRLDNDLNIYDKNEPLKLVWIFISNTGLVDILRVEDSHGKWKDLTLDEFSNILYFRVIQGYGLNTTYDAKGSEDLELLYVKDKSQSFLAWCESQVEFGQYIINNAQLPHGITLVDFSKGSTKKININCPKHGIYEQRVGNITKYKHGCPKCSTPFSTSYPEQFIFWALKQLYQKCKSRHKIEGLEVDVFIPEKNTCIEYNGYPWHEGKEYMDLQKRNYIESIGYNFITISEYQDKRDTAFNGNNIDFCYTCSNRNDRLKELVQYIVDKLLQADSSLINFKEVEKNAWEYSKGKIAYEDSVAYLFPKLTEEWDSLNFIKIEDITPGSRQRIQWVCKNCGNKWTSTINSRTSQKSGCPACHFNIFDEKIHSWEEKARNADNNVVRLYPKLAKEFLPELNEGKQLEDYTAGSRVKMTWKCTNCSHIWNTSVISRTYNKSGCPCCGWNSFTGKINALSKHTTHQKKQPIAVVNGVEIHI